MKLKRKDKDYRSYMTKTVQKKIMPSNRKRKLEILQRPQSEVAGTSLFTGACPKQNR